MPAIYQSFEPQPQDDAEVARKRIYLGIISCEEQAYTLGAAIGECRKQLTALDESVRQLKKAWDETKRSSEKGAQR